MQNSSLKKSCTKPGTFSGPKRLKKGSGFLFLHYFFVQVAIAFLFCNSLFVLRFSIYYFAIGGFSPLGKLFVSISCLRPADRRPVLIHTILAAKKGTSLSQCLLLAEMVGFEPTCPIKDKTISSRSRYDHFDTSPYSVPLESHGKLISRTIQA